MGRNQKTIPIKLSSSTTACLIYLAMLTNTIVVSPHNYPLEASSVVRPFGSLGLKTWNFKVGQANSWAFWTFWLAFCVVICKDGKVFSRICVEDFSISEFSNSNVLIGLLEFSIRQWLYFSRVIRSFFWCGNLTGSVDRNLVNTSCALLMMEATTSETSPMLDCYVLV